MITSINEFRKYLIVEYNNSAMKDHYNKLINDGSEEQEALLNTAAWFETTKDIVNQALQDAANTFVNEILTIRPAYFVKDTESIENILKKDFPEYEYIIDNDKENIVINIDDTLKHQVKNKLMDVIINKYHIDLINMY